MSKVSNNNNYNHFYDNQDGNPKGSQPQFSMQQQLSDGLSGNNPQTSTDVLNLSTPQPKELDLVGSPKVVLAHGVMSDKYLKEHGFEPATKDSARFTLGIGEDEGKYVIDVQAFYNKATDTYNYRISISVLKDGKYENINPDKHPEFNAFLIKNYGFDYIELQSGEHIDFDKSSGKYLIKNMTPITGTQDGLEISANGGFELIENEDVQRTNRRFAVALVYSMYTSLIQEYSSMLNELGALDFGYWHEVLKVGVQAGTDALGIENFYFSSCSRITELTKQRNETCNTLKSAIDNPSSFAALFKAFLGQDYKDSNFQELRDIRHNGLTPDDTSQTRHIKCLRKFDEMYPDNDMNKLLEKWDTDFIKTGDTIGDIVVMLLLTRGIGAGVRSAGKEVLKEIAKKNMKAAMSKFVQFSNAIAQTTATMSLFEGSKTFVRGVTNGEDWTVDELIGRTLSSLGDGAIMGAELAAMELFAISPLTKMLSKTFGKTKGAAAKVTELAQNGGISMEKAMEVYYQSSRTLQEALHIGVSVPVLTAGFTGIETMKAALETDDVDDYRKILISKAESSEEAEKLHEMSDDEIRTEFYRQTLIEKAETDEEVNTLLSMSAEDIKLEYVLDVAKEQITSFTTIEGVALLFKQVQGTRIARQAMSPQYRNIIGARLVPVEENGVITYEIRTPEDKPLQFSTGEGENVKFVTRFANPDDAMAAYSVVCMNIAQIIDTEDVDEPVSKEDLIQRINAANTIEELSQVLSDIEGTEFSSSDRAYLESVYRRRASQIIMSEVGKENGRTTEQLDIDEPPAEFDSELLQQTYKFDDFMQGLKNQHVSFDLFELEDGRKLVRIEDSTKLLSKDRFTYLEYDSDGTLYDAHIDISKEQAKSIFKDYAYVKSRFIANKTRTLNSGLNPDPILEGIDAHKKLNSVKEEIKNGKRRATKAEVEEKITAIKTILEEAEKNNVTISQEKLAEQLGISVGRVSYYLSSKNLQKFGLKDLWDKVKNPIGRPAVQEKPEKTEIETTPEVQERVNRIKRILKKAIKNNEKLTMTQLAAKMGISFGKVASCLRTENLERFGLKELWDKVKSQEAVGAGHEERVSQAKDILEEALSERKGFSIQDIAETLGVTEETAKKFVTDPKYGLSELFNLVKNTDVAKRMAEGASKFGTTENQVYTQDEALMNDYIDALAKQLTVLDLDTKTSEALVACYSKAPAFFDSLLYAKSSDGSLRLNKDALSPKTISKILDAYLKNPKLTEKVLFEVDSEGKYKYDFNDSMLDLIKSDKLSNNVLELKDKNPNLYGIVLEVLEKSDKSVYSNEDLAILDKYYKNMPRYVELLMRQTTEDGAPRFNGVQIGNLIEFYFKYPTVATSLVREKVTNVDDETLPEYKYTAECIEEVIKTFNEGNAEKIDFLKRLLRGDGDAYPTYKVPENPSDVIVQCLRFYGKTENVERRINYNNTVQFIEYTEEEMQDLADKIRKYIQQAYLQGRYVDERELVRKFDKNEDFIKQILKSKKYGFSKLIVPSWHDRKSREADINKIQAVLEEAVKNNKSLSIHDIANKLDLDYHKVAYYLDIRNYESNDLLELWDKVQRIGEKSDTRASRADDSMTVDRTSKPETNNGYEFKAPKLGTSAFILKQQAKGTYDELFARGRKMLESFIRNFKNGVKTDEPRVFTVGDNHLGFTVEKRHDGSTRVIVKNWLGDKESWDKPALVEETFVFELNSKGQMTEGTLSWNNYNETRENTEFSYNFTRSEDGNDVVTYREEYFGNQKSEYNTENTPEEVKEKTFVPDANDNNLWKESEEGTESLVYRTGKSSLLNMFLGYARVDGSKSAAETKAPEVRESETEAPAVPKEPEVSSEQEVPAVEDSGSVELSEVIDSGARDIKGKDGKPYYSEADIKIIDEAYQKYPDFIDRYMGQKAADGSPRYTAEQLAVLAEFYDSEPALIVKLLNHKVMTGPFSQFKYTGECLAQIAKTYKEGNPKKIEFLEKLLNGEPSVYPDGKVKPFPSEFIIEELARFDKEAGVNKGVNTRVNTGINPVQGEKDAETASSNANFNPAITPEVQARIDKVRALLEESYAKNEPVSVQQIAEVCGISVTVAEKMVTYEPYGLSKIFVPPMEFNSRQLINQIRTELEDAANNNEKLSLAKLAERTGINENTLIYYLRQENAQKFGLKDLWDSVKSQERQVQGGITPEVQERIDKIRTLLEESYAKNEAISPKQIAEILGLKEGLVIKMLYNEQYGLSELYIPPKEFNTRLFVNKMKTILEEAVKNNEKISMAKLAEQLGVEYNTIVYYFRPENIQKFGLKDLWDKIKSQEKPAQVGISPQVQAQINKIRAFLTKSYAEGKIVLPSDVAMELGISAQLANTMLTNEIYGLSKLYISQTEFSSRQFAKQIKTVLEEAAKNNEKLTEEQLAEKLGVDISKVKFFLLPRNAKFVGIAELWDKVQSQETSDSQETSAGSLRSQRVQARIDDMKAYFEELFENGVKVTAKQVAEIFHISTANFSNMINNPKYGLAELWDKVKAPSQGRFAKDEISLEIQQRINTLKGMLEEALSKNEPLPLAKIAEALGIKINVASRMVTYGPYGLGELWSQVKTINQKARKVVQTEDQAQPLISSKFEFIKPDPDESPAALIEDATGTAEELFEKGQRLISNLLQKLPDDATIKEPKVLTIGNNHFGFTIEINSEGNRVITIKNWLGDKEAWNISAIVEEGLSFEIDGNGRMIRGKFFSGDNHETEYSYTFESNKDGESVITYREDKYGYKSLYRNSSVPTRSSEQEYIQSNLNPDSWVAKLDNGEGFDGQNWRFVDEVYDSELSNDEFGYDPYETNLMNLFLGYAKGNSVIRTEVRETESGLKAEEAKQAAIGLKYLEEQEAAERKAKEESDARNEEWVKTQRAKREKEYEEMYKAAEEVRKKEIAESLRLQTKAKNEEWMKVFGTLVEEANNDIQKYNDRFTEEQKDIIENYKSVLQDVENGYKKAEELYEIIDEIEKFCEPFITESRNITEKNKLLEEELTTMQSKLDAAGIDFDISAYKPYGESTKNTHDAEFIVNTISECDDLKQAVSIIKYCQEHLDKNGQFDINRKNEYILSLYDLEYPEMSSVNSKMLDSINKIIKSGKISKTKGIEYVANLRTMMLEKPLEEFTITEFTEEFDIKNDAEQSIIQTFFTEIYMEQDTKAVTTEYNGNGTFISTITPSAKYGLYEDLGGDFKVCVEKMKAFEDALTKTAPSANRPGIKPINKDGLYELKIGGNIHIRMFNSHGGYVFDVYLPDDGQLGKSKAYQKKYKEWEKNIRNK